MFHGGKIPSHHEVKGNSYTEKLDARTMKIQFFAIKCLQARVENFATCYAVGLTEGNYIPMAHASRPNRGELYPNGSCQ